jgi:hypothetical protein
MENEEVKIFSEHIFMFPFEWNLPIKESLTKRLNMERIKELCEVSGWALAEPFISNNAMDNADNNYNFFKEYNFFYEAVRRLIYNQAIIGKEQRSLSVFEKNIQSFFEIKITEQKTYKLDIKKIELRIFETGVGVLSFILQNSRHESFNDILNINQYGRRIYNPYLACDSNNNIYPGYDVPIYIKVGDFIEDFGRGDRKKLFQMENISFVVMEILGKRFSSRHNSIETNENAIIKPIIDDRMYVMSWIKNNDISEGICKDYANSEDWYKYIFIDKDNFFTCQSDNMLRYNLIESTYDRWVNWGTLYGISRYSFVMLANERIEPYLTDTFTNIYRQMAIIALVQRATALRFTEETAKVSKLSEASNQVFKEVKDLHRNYLDFINRIRFLEITAQEQGIELFNKLTSIMHIQRDVDILDNAIGKLNNYVEIQSQQEINESIHILTTLGIKLNFFSGFFALIGVTISVLSIFITLSHKNYWLDYQDGFYVAIGLLIISVSCIIWFISAFMKYLLKALIKYLSKIIKGRKNV